MKKKTFKKAGVAVLSMAMLLSMGAMATPVSAATGDNVSVTIPASTSGIKLYKVASATYSSGTFHYTINPVYASVLEVKANGNVAVKTALTKAANGADVAADTLLNNITDHSSEAQALANALKAKTGDETDAGMITKVEAAGADTSLAPGYYIALANTVGESEPVLLSVTDTSGVTAIGALKTGEVTMVKTIESIAGATTNIKNDADGNAKGTGLAQVGDVIAYKLATNFPNYDDSVVAGTDITNFVITDTPEDTISITFGKAVDSSGKNEDVEGFDDTDIVSYTGITVQVDGSAADASQYTVTKNAASGTNGAGFTVTFADDYVIANGGDSVIVTFSAELTANPDVKTDSNDNNVTLSYSNNYDTGVGTFNNDGTPDPDNPKTETDDAKIYCATIGVNKQDENGADLTGAEFALFEGTATTGTPLLTYTDGDASFSFDGLKPGTYTIVETVAPPNYNKADPYTFVVSNTETTTDYKGVFTFTHDTADITNVVITDYPGQTLPGTGGIGTYLFTFGGAAIILLAGVMFVFYMKKRNAED